MNSICIASTKNLWERVQELDDAQVQKEKTDLCLKNLSSHQLLLPHFPCICPSLHLRHLHYHKGDNLRTCEIKLIRLGFGIGGDSWVAAPCLLLLCNYLYLHSFYIGCYFCQLKLDLQNVQELHGLVHNLKLVVKVSSLY